MIFIFKAVGQSIKAWILTHKKFYFFIVGVIAFIAFMAITLHGVKRASAATDNGSISVPYGESSTYSLGLRDYPYYVVFTNYLNDTEHFVAFLTDEPMSYGNGFSDTDLLSGGVRTLFVHRENNGEGEYVVTEETIGGDMSLRYLPENSSEVYSNYDIMRGSYEVVFPANPLPVPTLFDKDAPYFKFKRITGSIGRLPEKKLGNTMSDFKDVASSSEWVYMGTLENMSNDAERYVSMLEITVVLPTFEWLDNALDEDNGVAYYEHSDISHLLSNIDSAYVNWNKHTSSAYTQTYTFTYPLIIEPTVDGSFNFTLTYEEILAYIKYLNDDTRSFFNQYSYGHQCLMSTFAKIKSLSGSVVTTYPTAEITGRKTYNEWGSLTYDSCFEIILDIDENEGDYQEEFEKVYEERKDEYINGLYGEIAGLEDELDRYKDIQSSFGNLSGSDVWSTFSSLVTGLTTFASSVRGVAVMAGSVLAFFPLQISSMISFTLVSLCIIAIIKALRG